MKTYSFQNKSIQLLRFSKTVNFKLSLREKRLFFFRFLLQIILVFAIIPFLAACWETTGTTFFEDSPPTYPTNLIARAVSSDQIDLSWEEPHDDYGVVGYKIYRNGAFVQNNKETVFSDTGLNPETQYCYTVSAYDQAGNEGLLSDATCAVSSWIITTISSKVTYMESWLSVAIGSEDKVFLSYREEGETLKFATNTIDGWITETLDNPGRLNSLAIDSIDSAHISYAGLGDYLSYATNASGVWATENLDSTLSVEDTSIAVDSIDYVHISYNDYKTLKYITNASGNWSIEILENLSGYSDIYPSSISVDLSGNVHISFIERNSTDQNEILKYITNASGPWSTDIVEIQKDLGYYNSIAVDSAGNVNICYYDDTNHKLKHATNATGVWISETVDMADVRFYGLSISISVDSYGNSHISYYDPHRECLKYATNASGAWESYIIDDWNGPSSTIYNSTSIALDSAGKVHIAYHHFSGLRYVTNR
jgi:hypothetical protein